MCHRFLSFVLLYQGHVDEASKLFEEGVLKGQASYLGAFTNYYSAINDERALAFLISIVYPDDIFMRKLYYRFHTDNSYNLDEFNAETRAYIKRSNTIASPKFEYSLESLEADFIADYLWSPYQPILRRPELLDKYLQARKKPMMKLGMDDYWRKHGFPPQCRAVGDDDFECDLIKGIN